MNYYEHFNASTVPVTVLQTLREIGFEDSSWGNDEYPSFSKEVNNHFITAMFICHENTTRLQTIDIFTDANDFFKSFFDHQIIDIVSHISELEKQLGGGIE